MKTIEIKDETYWLLNQIKTNAKYKNFDDLLQTEICMSAMLKGALKESFEKSKK